MNTDIQALKNQLAELKALEAEYTAMHENAQPLRDRLSVAHDAKEKAEAILWGTRALHQSEEVAAKNDRAAALSAISAITGELQKAERDIAAVVLRIRDLTSEIDREAYVGASAAELQALGRKCITGIRACAAESARLSSERNSLFAKRQQAEEAIEAVEAAEDELRAARAAFDKQQSDAFIGGGDIDMAPYSARVERCEERVQTAAHKAVPANAALPRIKERLTAIEKEMGSVEEVSEGHHKAWDVNKEHKAVLDYRRHQRGMLDAGQTLLALGKRTNSNLGWRLLEGARAGLLTPIGGGHTERANTGPMQIPDVSSELRRLDAELLAELDAIPRVETEDPL